MSRPLVPQGAPVVGIVGGGQLARMCAGPATELGLGVVVLAESADAAAAQVYAHAPVGRADDLERLQELARVCDVVTFDHEKMTLRVPTKKAKTAGMGEDDQKMWSDEVQELTDKAIAAVDKALETKQQEIMQV